ncbi:MAG: GAF domain-containing protein [Halobacteria archaeon]|nr:GAF domain-containing protein [Halobacteria archaeon]
MEPGKLTLRGRLLVRLSGLLLVLILLCLVALAGPAAVITDTNRTLISGVLFAAGCGLIFSILSLVQNHLLDLLGQIRTWARNLREGRYSDPIPTPVDSSCAGLADDLNRLGSRLRIPAASGTGTPGTREPESASLQVLYEVVSSINTAHGLDDLLNRFLFTLKRITAAHAAVIWLAYHPSRVELGTSSGIDESLIMPERTDVRRCLYERAMTEGKIWIDKNLDKCEKIAGRPFFDKQDIALASIPMRYRGNIVGVINLFLGKDRIEHIESMKPLLNSVGHHLSTAIERSRSDEETHKHLISEERTRIAHELHDSLAQTLASIRYQVRVLDETLHQGDESTTWQQLERIENSLDEANTELRELISNFRAPVSGRGLIGAIEQTVSQYRSETGIKTYLQKEWAVDNLPNETEIQILRIIQEALWNIRKHSQAKTVRIMLRHRFDHKYHILIEDDGIGFRETAHGSPGEHVGLTIMRERASRIGGKLRVESEPGEGTRVVLEFTDPKPQGGKA